MKLGSPGVAATVAAFAHREVDLRGEDDAVPAAAQGLDALAQVVSGPLLRRHEGARHLAEQPILRFARAFSSGCRLLVGRYRHYLIFRLRIQ